VQTWNATRNGHREQQRILQQNIGHLIKINMYQKPKQHPIIHKQMHKQRSVIKSLQPI
jgi:hypothetical protein